MHHMPAARIISLSARATLSTPPRCLIASGALRHRLLQRTVTPPYPPGSPVRCLVRTAQGGTPNSGTTLPWLIVSSTCPPSLSIFDGLSRQSPEGEQTFRVFVTLQAQHSTVTTCVAGDPPLCDNRNYAAVFIEHRAVVADSNAGLDADVRPFPAPSSSHLLDSNSMVRNPVTPASDTHQSGHNGQVF
ncbi:hypothetical protein SVAN01_04597 [Stagonosporopsis vannaccii]|nr:hypothetical protein SVAN01_04597 [Stagonosporopsis vannaccii]